MSGKSTLLMNLILTAVALGRFCFVLDRKFSYRDTVLACGGKWIQLNANCGINPFALEVDFSDEQKVKNALLYYMSFLEGIFERSFKNDEEKERKLMEALRELLLYPVEKRSFDVLYEKIDDSELKSMIYPFTRDGRYGGVFGPNPIIPEGDYPVVCYEIDEIERMRDSRLSRVVYLTVLTALYGFLEEREGYKYVIMEEVPGLLKYPFMREALMEQLQQYRKVDASVTLVLQDPSVFESLLEGDIGAVASSQVTNIMMYPIGIEKAEENSIFARMGINNEVLYRLEHGSSGIGYRDFYLMTKTKHGEIRTFCRMMLPPTLKYISNSFTSEVRARERAVKEIMEKENCSYEEALYKLILSQVSFVD